MWEPSVLEVQFLERVKTKTFFSLILSWINKKGVDRIGKNAFVQITQTFWTTYSAEEHNVLSTEVLLELTNKADLILV